MDSYSPELEPEYTLKVKEHKLIGFHSRHGYFDILPIQKNVLSADAFYFADFKVEHWPKGDIKGLKVSNGRVGNVWFGKMK